MLVENFSVGRHRAASKSTTRRSASANPGLVYCSITSYGQSGPRRKAQGLTTPVTQAVLGALMNLTGFPRRPPPPRRAPPSRTASGARFAYGAITTALLHRERTGQGQWIDVSMVDCPLVPWYSMSRWTATTSLGLPDRPGETASCASPPFNAYQAKGRLAGHRFGHRRPLEQYPARRGDARKLVGDARYADLSGRITNNDEGGTPVITQWDEKSTPWMRRSRKLRRFRTSSADRSHTIRDILAWPAPEKRGDMIEDLPPPHAGVL